MIRFRRDVRAWLINAAQRWCGAGFVVTLACFVAITTYPYEPLNPFARSAFAVPASGGFRFDTPSVFRTPTGIAQLDSEAFRQGRFSVELWVKPEHATQHESSRFVSYSLDEEHPLWMVSQRGEQISIKHRGRGAYVRTLEIDSLRHYVVALAGDRAHVYRDGQHVATRQLLPATVQPWHSSHLTVANEVTGDRPFIGAIRQLTLFSRTLSAEEIRRIAAGEAVEPPGFTLEGNPSEQRLWLNSSPPIPLERVPWPYRHKWELSRHPISPSGTWSQTSSSTWLRRYLPACFCACCCSVGGTHVPAGTSLGSPCFIVAFLWLSRQLSSFPRKSGSRAG